MNKKQIVFWCLGALVFAVLMTVFAFTDLAIVRRLHNPESLFAGIFQTIGMLPLYPAASACGLMIFASRDKADPRQYRRSTIWGAVLTFLGINLGLNVTIYYVYFNLYISLASYPLSVLLVWLLIRRVRKADPLLLKPYRKTAAAGICFFLMSFFSVQVLKLLWGRVRYTDLAGPEDFTRWYIPRGFTGNQSFPSLHVAGASAILFLVLLTYQEKFRSRRLLFWGISGAYIFLVALSRIVAGVHYPSDVLFAFGLAVVSLEISRRIAGIREPAVPGPEAAE